MIIVNDLKPGTTFEHDGNIFIVLDIDHNKTAMRQMIVKVKVKNLRTGVINEISFTGGDKVEQAHIDKKEMQYLYDEGESLVFMDNDTYDQIEILKDHLTWERQFMKENDTVTVSMYENEILGIILPDKVNLKIVECEPAVKGDTSSGKVLKAAQISTGFTIQVPLFVAQGEKIEIDSRTGEYRSRAK